MSRHYTVWGVVCIAAFLLGGWCGGEAAPKKRGQQSESESQEQRGLQVVPESGSTVSGADRRTALVIGNGAYADSPLKNPVNDANDMAAALKRLGFTVILLNNADLRKMHEATEDFSRQLRRNDVGLFYYAGHGLQVSGENYLLPIGARIGREQDVQFETYNVGRLLGIMEEAGNALNLIILDACRNNPFPRSVRSTQGGLAALQATPGSLIAYATAPGSVAADGASRNGVYTRHLLQHMQTPGLAVEEMFKQVRISVRQETGQKQTPWESSSLTRSFAFASSTGAPVPPPAVTVAPAPQSQAQTLAPRPQTQTPVVAALPPQTQPRPPVSASQAAGKALVNSLQMEFVHIPPGEFIMGADGSNGIPTHKVVISRPFYMAKYEVTQAQWVTIMGENPSTFKGTQQMSSLGKEIKLDPDRPVDSVSWNEVQTFIARLNAQEGQGKYRLPTEAEWEYAARAGTSLSAGSGPLEQYGWCAPQAKGTTHAVGQLQPNGWGLYDMAGNVFEWVEDWFAAYKNDSLTDPKGPPSGVIKVFRGGAWNQPPAACQPAYRLYDTPAFKFPSVGFRLAHDAY